jgi:hypothetical protein
MWRAYRGVIHCGFEQIPNLQNTAAEYLYWSICKKSRHLGFGVFIDIWSMDSLKKVQNEK